MASRGEYRIDEGRQSERTDLQRHVLCVEQQRSSTALAAAGLPPPAHQFGWRIEQSVAILAAL
jgi:hypothetical protein